MLFWFPLPLVGTSTTFLEVLQLVGKLLVAATMQCAVIVILCIDIMTLCRAKQQKNAVIKMFSGGLQVLKTTKFNSNLFPPSEAIILVCKL